MKNRNWNEEPEYDLKWLVVGLIVALVWSISSKHSHAKTTDYGFPPVTMDVLKADGRSGTFLCPSERWCYTKALEYEARGGEQYCVSLTMKRDGKVVWYRRYQ